VSELLQFGQDSKFTPKGTGCYNTRLDWICVVGVFPGVGFFVGVGVNWNTTAVWFALLGLS
jgi:hypothetical protein